MPPVSWNQARAVTKSCCAAGGSGAGEDEAKLLNTSWGRTRTSVHGAGLDAFHFRQYLFACQARLLLALQRPVEVSL